jgi:hypothetical protein
MSSRNWSPLGTVDPRELVDTRIAVHYAAQPLAASGFAMLAMQPDQSNTNLLWSPERKRFAGRPLRGGSRVILDVAGFRTGVLDASGREIALVDPSGKTLDRVFSETAEALRQAGERVPDAGLALPEYDLPAAPVAQGEPFPAPDAAALEELARWFHDGFLVLSEVAEKQLGGAEVRCWPHHFDMAALLTLDPEADPEDARSVGVGLSPGDGTYAEPYFYVSPWPYPDAGDLPRLAEGARWHTEGFTSAILTGSELVSAGGGAAQLERARGVLSSTVSACRALLER